MELEMNVFSMIQPNHCVQSDFGRSECKLYCVLSLENCTSDRAAALPIVDNRCSAMTIPFGEPEPSVDLLNKSMWSTRLRSYLDARLRKLASEQRIQDARALRHEFELD